MTEIANVFCALDATPFVVKQAAAGGADMLVVHHTPLWTPLTTMTGRTALLMRDLLSSGMNLYVMHTNFDRADGGVNDALAGLLSLGDTNAHVAGKSRQLHDPPPGNLPRLGGNLRVWGKIPQIRKLAHCRRQRV